MTYWSSVKLQESFLYFIFFFKKYYNITCNVIYIRWKKWLETFPSANLESIKSRRSWYNVSLLNWKCNAFYWLLKFLFSHLLSFFFFVNNAYKLNFSSPILSGAKVWIRRQYFHKLSYSWADKTLTNTGVGGPWFLPVRPSSGF